MTTLSCPIVFYELWRGLSYRGADRRRHGRTHDDADLLIAAFARRLRATLVTNNTADFTDLDVPVVDWTADQSGS